MLGRNQAAKRWIKIALHSRHTTKHVAYSRFTSLSPSALLLIPGRRSSGKTVEAINDVTSMFKVVLTTVFKNTIGIAGLLREGEGNYYYQWRHWLCPHYREKSRFSPLIRTVSMILLSVLVEDKCRIMSSNPSAKEQPTAHLTSNWMATSLVNDAWQKHSRNRRKAKVPKPVKRGIFIVDLFSAF